MEILKSCLERRVVGTGLKRRSPLLRVRAAAEGEELGNLYSFHPGDGQDCPDNCKTWGIRPLFWGWRLQFGGGDSWFFPS